MNDDSGDAGREFTASHGQGQSASGGHNPSEGRDTGELRGAERTLADVQLLRTRARALAHGGVWFPVAVIAALLLLSISLYSYPFTEPSTSEWLFPYWGGLPDTQRNQGLSYAFWFVLTPAAFGLIAWWYRRRSRRLGVRIEWRWFVGAGLGALLALALLAAFPSTVDLATMGELDSGQVGHTVDVLRGLRTPIVPLAAALVVLSWAERSLALATTGLWIGILAWWFCAAGPGRLPGWLTWILGGFEGPALGGTLAIPGRPGPVLIAMSAPLLVYAFIRGLRARR